MQTGNNGVDDAIMAKKAHPARVLRNCILKFQKPRVVDKWLILAVNDSSAKGLNKDGNMPMIDEKF